MTQTEQPTLEPMSPAQLANPDYMQAPASTTSTASTTTIKTPVEALQEEKAGVSGSEDKAIAVVSGGMDSVAMLYRMYEERTKDITVICFNYGQRHFIREVQFSAMHAQVLGLDHWVIPVDFLGDFYTKLGSESSLINEEVDVPDGHYAEESMKQTVVPNRNMIMSSMSIGAAVAARANIVGLGVHGGDHFIYPDCRPDFFYYLELAARHGNVGFGHEKPIELWTPWMHVSKTDIVRWAYDQEYAFTASREVKVDLRYTWSCYKGGVAHCGECGTCTERKEAFTDAGVPDPTVYRPFPKLAPEDEEEPSRGHYL